MPLWKASDVPRFFNVKQRDEMPEKADYADADPDNEDDRSLGFDNEGKNSIYWEHMEEWELTTLRKLYEQRMTVLCPSWGDRREERTRMLDLEEVITRAYDDWYHGRIYRWLDEVKSGKKSSFRAILGEESAVSESDEDLGD